jgi:hypothetical protein
LDTFIEGGDVDVALRNVLMACGVPVRLDKYDYNANSGWPERTGALCHWCCHGFEGMPFGIPVARRAGKYHVIDNFCSLECAAASNFDRSRGSDLAWERNMLINELSAAVGNGLVKVTPAPTRELLQQFGGDMDITKFRGMVRRVRLVYPPCMVVELAHDGHATEHAFKQAARDTSPPLGSVMSSYAARTAWNLLDACSSPPFLSGWCFMYADLTRSAEAPGGSPRVA